MSSTAKVLIYGASGYTGKLVAESLADRNIPFVFAGRNRERLEEGLRIVEERVGRPVDAVIGVAGNTVEELLPLLQEVEVVINVAGPSCRLHGRSWKLRCRPTATTWTPPASRTGRWPSRKSTARRLRTRACCWNPANSYMWAAGAWPPRSVLETEGVDSLDLVYQIDHGLPSEASTKSFLRMICNEQYYLELNELKTLATRCLSQGVGAASRPSCVHCPGAAPASRSGTWTTRACVIARC